jgi:hypothetical protein
LIFFRQALEVVLLAVGSDDEEAPVSDAFLVDGSAEIADAERPLLTIEDLESPIGVLDPIHDV